MLLADSDINKAICFSGPRPIKYIYTDERLEKINTILYSEIIGLLRAGYDTLLFGGAPGFDLVSLKAALKIKEELDYKNIRLICALPFEKFSESQHFDDYWRKLVQRSDAPLRNNQRQRINQLFSGLFSD